MQVKIRHNPSNAVARCALDGGEVLKVQPDAMIAHSPGVVLTAGADGGVMKGLRRKVLGGESFFITTYTAPPEGGWVDCATHLLGDVFSLEVSEEHGLLISRGGWVASSTTIALDSKWGGLKNLMGGEGGFIVRASGAGTIVLACFGALDIWDLAPGETFTLDTNHMVAYEETRELQAPPRRRGPLDPVVQERRGLGLRVHRARPRLRPDALAAVAPRLAPERDDGHQQLADGRWARRPALGR